MAKKPTEKKTRKPKLKTDLASYLEEVNIDEESLLANLAFDPVIIGRQLLENHFSTTDFQGAESNRVLLGCMLELISQEQTLNLVNLVQILTERKKGKKTCLEIAGGDQRIQELFLSPFNKPGVSMLEDIEPLIEKIRDRNIRRASHRSLIMYSEHIMQNDKDAFEILGNGIQELRNIFLKGSSGHINTMDSHIEEMRELIALNKHKECPGYNTNFPILCERLGGLLKEFYLVTGGVGMGKSTFATQLAWDLAILNPELTVLYFSLDLNRLDATSKIIAQAAHVPIDYVRNPAFPTEELEKKRLAGIELISSMKDRLMIVDESSGRLFIEDIKKYVKRVRLERAGEVAVIIDPLFKIQTRGSHMLKFHEKCNYLAAELKSLSAVEQTMIVATAGLPKAVSNRRPIREDLEEIMGLLYDPYAVFFLYSDYLNDFDTPFLEWEWGKEDSFMIPISEALIAKNKMGAINSRIFFRYFEAYSQFKECAPQEIENYLAMIENLEKFKSDQNLRRNNQNSRTEEF